MPRKSYFHKREKTEISPLLIRMIKSIGLWTVLLSLVVGSAYLLSNTVFEKTKMSGGSMEPTIEENMILVINKLAYQFSDPKRFDVIVYKQSNKEHSYFEVKRVIALPGEKIEIREGMLYINNEKVEEVVKIIPSLNAGLAEDGVILGENEYFVMGDNREESEDSRFASSGNILKSEIIGKAVFVEKPFSIVDSLNRIEKK